MNVAAFILISVVPAICFAGRQEPRNAVCNVQPDPRSSQPVTGVVRFFQSCQEKELVIKVELSGFNPLPYDASNADRSHGFHVHQFGNLTGNCDSTGPHYNPGNVTHGGPNDKIRHAGDFGNILQNNDGTLEVKFNDKVATLFGGRSIIGRGLVIHSGEDDLGRGGAPTSSTTGNSGSRLACCVIGWA